MPESVSRLVIVVDAKDGKKEVDALDKSLGNAEKQGDKTAKSIKNVGQETGKTTDLFSKFKEQINSSLGKAGSGEARKAVIAPDSAQSKTYIKILYGLSEGEVEGLANGLQSVYLEETPLHNPSGGSNFQDIQFDFRHGTNDQTHIEGFPDISSETAINVELVSGTPWVRAISNTDLDAVRIRFKWGPLRQQNADNGDVKGITIQYAIDLQTGGGSWVEVLNTKISDKTSANYERSHRIDLPKSDTGWTIRVRRITPNSTSEYFSDKMYVDALTEVIDLNGGRISAVSADRKIITLDRDDVVCRAGDRLVVNGEDGKAQARIVSSKIGRAVTVTVAFDSVAPQNVWVVDAQDLKTMKFRVMSITQDEKHQFSITALQYESSKYDAIDFGAFIDERPISIINPTIQAPVTNVLISSETMVHQGLAVETMLITWDQAQGATKYQVEWRKDDGNWIKLPITGSNSVEVQGIYVGNYEARVTAISAFDVASLPTYSILTTLSGKQGLPPALADLAATGILFGYRLDWNFPAVGALDTAYTEIEIATTANGANAAQLGLFAYPTDTHVIQGMQPNLTRYFRGRLIDRIGNIGPWSSWVSATTSADASAVLDVLSGKISETQLSQGLIEKIENSDLENNQAFIDVQQKIEGLDAQYYLRIQSGKYVSGFGLGVDGGSSDFIVHSDSFALGNPAGGDEGVSYPFIFRNTPFTDPGTGTVFPVGAYMKSAFIDYASIDTAHIKQLAVKSAQIDDLAVTTAKIGDLQVDTLKIKDNAVTVPIGATWGEIRRVPDFSVPQQAA